VGIGQSSFRNSPPPFGVFAFVVFFLVWTPSVLRTRATGEVDLYRKEEVSVAVLPPSHLAIAF